MAPSVGSRNAAIQMLEYRAQRLAEILAAERAHVLYVDDNLASCELFINAVKNLPIEVEFAATEECAVRKAARCKAVVIDPYLRSEPIGLAIAKAIRTKYPDIPIMLYMDELPNDTVLAAMTSDTADSIVGKDEEGTALIVEFLSKAAADV